MMSSNPPVEDSKRIEEEVMAEIRAALDLPPTSMISIPKLVTSPQESPRESSTAATEEEKSFEENEDGEEDEEEVKEVPVKLKNASPKRNGVGSLDGSTMNDSFLMQLACNSSFGGSSAGISESSSQRFYIGTVDEDGEGSIQSHVSNLGTDEMSHAELMDVVHRLYNQLKKADETLSSEKKRRRSREKNLIKLAKELGRRKDAANAQMATIDEMREGLRVMSLEKTLLEQRLEAQKRQSQAVRVATQKQVDSEVEEVIIPYKQKLDENEARITELNKSHAKQCEELCREVVEANQEVMRLQKVLSEMIRNQTFDSTFSRDGHLSSASALASPVTKSVRQRVVGLKITIVILCGAICLGYNLHRCQPVMEMVDRMDSYMQSFALHTVESSPKDEDIEEVDGCQVNLEIQGSVSGNDLAPRATELSDVFSSNALPGLIFNPTLPLKWLREGMLSKNEGEIGEVEQVETRE